CISHLRGPRNDFAGDQHDALGAKPTCDLERRRRCVCRIERDLHDARAIAKIDEHEATEVASTMHPAAESNVGTNVINAKRPAERVTKSGLERRSGAHYKDSRRRSAV